MRKRYPIRRSGAAKTSRQLGVLALPVLIIGGLLYRSHYIDTTTLYGVLGVGFAIALIAVVASLMAFVRVWNTGSRGLSEAVRGFIFGIIALAPALAVAGAVFYYPRLSDVSTDLEAPPELMPLPRRSSPGGLLDPDLQRTAYPDIVPRRFPIGTAQLYGAVKQVVTARGWEVGAHLAPAMNDDAGTIRAQAHTMLLGFTDDVTIRILPDPIGSRLDIRSASRTGSHDLGENARRIRSFLDSVDVMLTEAYGITEMQESDTAPVEFQPDEIDKLNEPDVPVPTLKPSAQTPPTG